jgi:hypothetical protein
LAASGKPRSINCTSVEPRLQTISTYKFDLCPKVDEHWSHLCIAAPGFRFAAPGGPAPPPTPAGMDASVVLGGDADAVSVPSIRSDIVMA